MDRDLLAALVGSASTPASADQRPLARLTRRLWPGSADGTVPVAVPWLQRWGPHRTPAAVPRCACASGRCATCN